MKILTMAATAASFFIIILLYHILFHYIITYHYYFFIFIIMAAHWSYFSNKCLQDEPVSIAFQLCFLNPISWGLCILAEAGCSPELILEAVPIQPALGPVEQGGVCVL